MGESIIRVVKKAESAALMVVVMPVFTVAYMAHEAGKAAVESGKITLNWIKKIAK